ncbi:DNA topoisomerase 3 [Escherichia albertii]|nr:DNA topoisomerase 3 [Escherichia albertii]
MRLFIAEKPQIANDIVKGLGGQFTRRDGYYESESDVVTWCFGHILKSAEPQRYNPSYEKWNLTDLPLKLYPVKLEAAEGKEKQVKTVVDLIKKADTIVHAGDPDDEGQLLVDEVLVYAGNTKPVKRLLINDNTDVAVKKALANLKENNEFKGLYHKALARSVGDDIFGKSMTRAYTVTAQQKGYRGKPLSVGRVQTPILGLICRRWLDNQSHKESFYYTITGEFNHQGQTFNANWKVNENAPQDDKKRLIDKEYGERVANLCSGKPSEIVSAAVDDKQTAPPLPFNLVKLQQHMNKNHKMTAAKTLEITQQLREKYKAITYNRSDCSYLSDEQYNEAPKILDALKGLSQYADVQTNTSLKSKAFDSGKVTAHTAIIPTGNVPDINALTEHERLVYQAIAEHFLVQFLPNKRYQEASAVIKVETETFSCRATKITDKGFTAFLAGSTDEEEEAEQDSSSQFDTVASIMTGAAVQCQKATVNSKKTTPPALFTEASLLAALVRVADFVSDPHIKALLKAKDKDKKDEHGGIGTPATRHTMIEKLKSREFVILDKGKLTPTQKGLDFYHSLPSVATNPDMTALWSEKQQEIEQGELTVDSFIAGLYDDIQKLLNMDIAETLQVSAKSDEVSLSSPCPNCGKAVLERPKLFVCESQCGFKIWKDFRGKNLTKLQAEKLLKKGEVEIKGLKAKSGKPYDGICMMDKATGNISFKFKENKR